MFTYKKIKLFYSSTYFLILHFMTFDLISGLHMQIQTWHPPLRLCIHAKYYVKSGLTNVLKNANKTKNMHLFSIRIANYIHKRNKRSHCIRRNGNLKGKTRHVLTLTNLNVTSKHSGRHMALSRLATLSISSLRNLDIEAYKFYDRAHQL